MRFVAILAGMILFSVCRMPGSDARPQPRGFSNNPLSTATAVPVKTDEESDDEESGEKDDGDGEKRSGYAGKKETPPARPGAYGPLRKATSAD